MCVCVVAYHKRVSIYMHIYIYIYAYNIYREFGKYNIINPKPWSTHTRALPKTKDNFTLNFAHYPVFIKKRGNDVAVPASVGLLGSYREWRPSALLWHHPRGNTTCHVISPFFYEKGLSAKLRAKFLLLLASPYPSVYVCGYHS